MRSYIRNRYNMCAVHWSFLVYSGAIRSSLGDAQYIRGAIMEEYIGVYHGESSGVHGCSVNWRAIIMRCGDGAMLSTLRLLSVKGRNQSALF